MKQRRLFSHQSGRSYGEWHYLDREYRTRNIIFNLEMRTDGILHHPSSIASELWLNTEYWK
jgi:hypothetical protein